jgi:predicted anti-sigma-YlaC factor YlaD
MSILEISCLDVWREISNFIDDGVSPELRQRIEEHLKVCEHCTAIYDGTQNVIKLVADGRTYELPGGFSDRLRQRLEDRLHDEPLQ